MLGAPCLPHTWTTSGSLLLLGPCTHVQVHVGGLGPRLGPFLHWGLVPVVPPVGLLIIIFCPGDLGSMPVRDLFGIWYQVVLKGVGQGCDPLLGVAAAVLGARSRACVQSCVSSQLRDYVPCTSFFGETAYLAPGLTDSVLRHFVARYLHGLKLADLPLQAGLFSSGYCLNIRGGRMHVCQCTWVHVCVCVCGHTCVRVHVCVC